MLHRWSLGRAMVVALAIMAFAACSKELPKSIKVVHLAPVSAAYGPHVIDAARMAVDEINARGGVKLPGGQQIKIEYIVIDETATAAGAIEATKKAIALEPLVILGPNRSGSVLAAEKLWKEAKIAAITDATSAATTQQGNPYTFRMQISSEYWIPLLVKTAVERYNIKRPAVLYGLNDYSKANWVATEPAMAEFHLKPVTVQTFKDNDQDFSAQLLEIKKAQADAIFLYSYPPEIGKIARQRSALGMKAIPFFSERSASVPSVYDDAGKENYEGMVTSTTLSPGDGDTRVQAFIQKYESAYKRVISATHVNHYDSIYIIAELVSTLGPDREKLREGLAKLDYKGALAHYEADKEGNLVHHMHTQLFTNGTWMPLKTETYPVQR